MKRMPNSSKSDPDSDYLSKYLVDFNKRELEKFFHPDKFPKLALSVAAAGVMVFLFVAYLFPVKNTLLNKNYQKSPVSADSEKEVQNISISGPQSVKSGNSFTALVSIRSDKQAGRELAADIIYPEEYVKLIASKPLDIMNGQAKKLSFKSGHITFGFSFPNTLQTNGTYQELMSLTFIARKPGRANFTFDETSTSLKDASNQDISLWKNNYSVLITE